MGEIADMMLDGTMCAGCGEYLEKEPMGFPDYCSSCRPRRAKGYTSGGASKNAFVALGEKQVKRLRLIQDMTDAADGGEYPGCRLEDAPAKFRSLVNLGYAEFWEPHNPIHKTRVVITDLGREFLKKGGQRENQKGNEKGKSETRDVHPQIGGGHEPAGSDGGGET